MVRFTDNLIIQLTRDCNLHCEYCFQGNKFEWTSKTIDLDTFKKIVDTTIYYRCVLGRLENHIDFHFHGGEVTLLGEDLLVQMLEYVLYRKKYFPGIAISIQSNGLLVSETFYKYLVSKGITIGISFDGRRSTHRMSLEENDKLFEKIKYLSTTYGKNIGLLSVLTTENMKTWFEDMREIQPYVYSVGVNPVVTNECQDYLIPSLEDQYTYWLKPVLESYCTTDPVFERDVSIIIQKVVGDIVFELDKSNLKTGCFDRLCGHGSNMIAIDPNLNLASCDKFLEEGAFIHKREYKTLEDRDFLGLQQIKKVLTFYKDIVEAEDKVGCDFCKAKWMCNGECQSYMISKIGKVHIPNTVCDVYKRVYDFIKNNWITIASHNDVKLILPSSRIRTEALAELETCNKKILYNDKTNTFKVVDR